MRIIDLDNCIADDGWRIPMIGAKPEWIEMPSAFDNFYAYNALSIWDELRNADILCHNGLNAILTARPTIYRSITEMWLRRNNVQWCHMIMRNMDDERRSLDVKRTQVQWLLAFYGLSPDQIEVAYDDREDIVSMYASEFGMRAEQRAIHSIPYPHHRCL